MKFGIHSLLFSETFTERDLPLLDKAKAMGFDAVDIVPFDIDNFPAKLVRQRAADLGLDIIIEIGMPAHANTISPDPAIRAAGTELTKRLVDLSVEAGSQLFGGVNYCLLGLSYWPNANRRGMEMGRGEFSHRSRLRAYACP
jgi:D-psicose/D-tagatose/L-ribulose 3-epimerase